MGDCYSPLDQNQFWLWLLQVGTQFWYAQEREFGGLAPQLFARSVSPTAFLGSVHDIDCMKTIGFWHAAVGLVKACTINACSPLDPVRTIWTGTIRFVVQPIHFSNGICNDLRHQPNNLSGAQQCLIRCYNMMYYWFGYILFIDFLWFTPTASHCKTMTQHVALNL